MPADYPARNGKERLANKSAPWAVRQRPPHGQQGIDDECRARSECRSKLIGSANAIGFTLNGKIRNIWPASAKVIACVSVVPDPPIRTTGAETAGRTDARECQREKKEGSRCSARDARSAMR